ncbi:MAG: mechanosensitive ion channel [Rikenellaceae bacterium]|nr:mechanosensitive ion channel [Rikenellaceae bacterium]MBQ3536562.1 mechanosensitive ion channel [Alistipes sp.]
MEAISILFRDWVEAVLLQTGLSSELSSTFNRWIILLIIILFALLVDTAIRIGVSRLLQKIVSRTKATWDDYIFDKKVIKRLCNFITPTIIYILLPIAFSSAEGNDGMYTILKRGVEIYMVIACIGFINTLLKVCFEIAEQHPAWQGKPIKGLMQTAQGIVIGIGLILVVSILIDKSPTLLLTGLGASAAVLMLIFKDSILGLVAGVQLSANNMLKVGDWISLPKRGVDGEVEEVSLTTIKVRAWDKTLQMLPPYLLISEPFDNWQAMRSAGGRRIKRSLNVDMTTIKLADSAFIDTLRQSDISRNLIEPIQTQSAEGGTLTNLDLFMRAVNNYLLHHPRVNPNMTVMVRQLQPSQWGLPIEIYCFSADVNWVPYENLQTEIISYVVAVAPLFGLRMYQAPSSADLRN